MKISIVIVAWNLRDFLRECLASVYRETRAHPFEVVVVDNGSTDGTPDMVAGEFPAAVLLRSERNLGYVGASNLGLRRVLDEGRSELVLLLNADVVVREGAVDAMGSYLEDHPDVGAVGPALVLPDGRLQPGPAGFRPTIGAALSYFSFFFKLAPLRSRPLFVDPGALVRSGRPAPVSWLSGACLMVRSEIVRRVGLLDERFFLYADDVDWGMRMTRAGIALHFLSTVRVVHFHGATVRTVFREVNIHWLALLFRHVELDRGSAEALLVRITAAAGFGLRAGLYALITAAAPSEAAARRVRETAAFALASLFGRTPRP
jgi:GT2 family glycosyltransferase